MQLRSSAFTNNSVIPTKYTCKGSGISPPLSIENIESQVKSLAVLMHDPDAPSGDFTHWIVWNISPDTEEIAEGKIPTGSTEGMNDFGRVGYGFPCPPSGTHHYIFTLYALDISPDLLSGSKRSEFESEIQNHILDKTQLIGLVSSS